MMPRFRRLLALAICPELSEPRQAAASAPDPQLADRKANREIQDILTLAGALSSHSGLAVSTISLRASGRGSFFASLAASAPANITLARRDRVLNWFSRHWPEDLEWPSSIDRPDPKEDAA